jgi:hypothetical protein
MPLLHIGDHTVMSLSQFGWHLIEADHLAFAALTIVVGILAYRQGRRVEARVHAQRRDDRP